MMIIMMMIKYDGDDDNDYDDDDNDYDDDESSWAEPGVFSGGHYVELMSWPHPPPPQKKKLLTSCQNELTSKKK